MTMSKKKTLLEKIEPLQDIEAIQKLHKEMKELCLKAGITEKSYKSILRVNKESSEEDLKERREWLTDFYKGPYKGYKTAYEYVAPYVWENYKLTGTRDLPEQIILSRRIQVLRSAWKLRPKRSNNNNGKSNENNSSK
jgi:hypothetical protein